MSQPRPLNFLLICLGLLQLQLALSLLLAVKVWHHLGTTEKTLLGIALFAGIVHSFVLLIQLPQALRWRPRRSKRLSLEVLRERRRIARELHDRVGPQLVSALALIDPLDDGQAAQRAVLEHGLLELRLLVDNMEEAPGTLVEQLAKVRHRMQPVLQRQGIVLDWNTSAANSLSAPRNPMLALIAQEALSNVLQHANATRVRVLVSRSTRPAGWTMEIVDNGDGLPQGNGQAADGSGLKGMRERVLAAGGQVHLLRPADGGTCVRVSVPDRA